MTQPVPILLYHSVSEQCAEPYRRWAIAPDRFARHMAIIAGHGCNPVTMSALAAMLTGSEPVPARTVAITFDDGLRDFLTGAVPILRRFKYPATLYVVAGCLGATSHWLHPLGEGGRPMLSWRELRKAASLGFEIGAHTMNHPQLDLLPDKSAFEEIRLSKTAIEEGLGQPVLSFAYPHGYASPVTRRLVREAGFTSACRVRHALSSTAEDCFALSRIIMTNEITDQALAQFLEGSGLPVSPPTDRLLATGWRFVRKFKHMAGSPP